MRDHFKLYARKDTDRHRAFWLAVEHRHAVDGAPCELRELLTNRYVLVGSRERLEHVVAWARDWSGSWHGETRPLYARDMDDRTINFD